MEAKAIAESVKCDHRLITQLLKGITKRDLHAMLSDALKKSADGPEVDTARMNLIGSLRALGYIVEGGRKGRHVPYKIIGFEAKKTLRPIDEWGGEKWDWVKSLMPVVGGSRELVRTNFQLSRERRMIHEKSWQYLRCYELARDRGFWYMSDLGNRAIIIQKYQTTPRFRVFNFNLLPRELLDLATTLSSISLQAIRVVCISPEDARSLRELDTKGYITSRSEAVYRVDRILNDTSAILNSRAMTTLRKSIREFAWWGEDSRVIDSPIPLTIISTWRSLNEAKQRQLAVTRDEVSVRDAFEHPDDSDIHLFWGTREPELPSCLHIVDKTIGFSCVSQIVEKSLNYSSVPGGKYGTADYNLYKTCEALAVLGIDYINAGSYEGGGWGLPQHKQVFARPEDNISSYTFDFSLPHVRPEDIYAE